MPGIFSGCFAESVPNTSFRDLGTKSEPKTAKRDRKQFEMELKYDNATQMEPKGDQKGANRRKSCSKIMPWSVRSFMFFVLKKKNVKTVTAHLSVLPE